MINPIQLPAPPEATVTTPHNGLTAVAAGAVSKNVTRRRRKQVAKDNEVRAFLLEKSKKRCDDSDPTLVSESVSIPSLSTISWPLWRDLGHKPRVLYYQLALESMGPCFLCHLRLNHDLMALVKDKPEIATTYLRQRVALNLKRSLGRKVDFWFVLEADRGRNPHLHGAVGIEDQEREVARMALYTAARLTGEFKKYGLRLVMPTDGVGAAGYAVKNLSRTKFELRVKGVSATHPVTGAAKLLYERDLAMQKNRGSQKIALYN